MLLVSIAILIAVFVCIKIYARQGEEFELPDLVGANIDDVRMDKSLDIVFVVIDSVYDERSDGGTIRNQDPVAHTMVKAGRKVYVSITSFSQEKTTLPDLRDLSLRQAVSQLESVGLKCGVLRYISSPDKNAVIDFTLNGRPLSPGQEVSRGSRIDLVVGSGEAGDYVVVPFLIGKTAEEAHLQIINASFNVGDEFFDEGASRARAVVYRQEPDYTGVPLYPMGTAVILYYRDASQEEIQQMIREFTIDSSQIFNPEADADVDVYDNFMEF